MAKPPAYIFVVRHGMRLDAADKTWAESSATPYDTPLCYAGWIQARTVGARIATILAQAEADSEQAPTSTTSPRRRRRFKVAIHSSPFLRCVQTSIGISAGLAQPITVPPPVPQTPTRRTISTPMVLPSPILKPTRLSKPPPLPDLLNKDSLTLDTQPHHHHFHKAILRLDEFLGEWLSAEYYETISPPPKSASMIANAKAELLKREVYTQHFRQSLAGPTSPKPILSPQLWTGGGRTITTATVPEDPFEDTSDEDMEVHPDLPPPRPLGELGYIAPVPHYSVSSSDSIPDGYVSHARDSCVVFDYQWESSAPDLDWGNGGVFPEEWTSMHNRFRKGVQRLVDWYATTEDAADIGHIRGAAEKDKIEDTWSEDGDDDVDIETVVIMVSHGAGCNALIGAMTHQPALMDVSMASLTMAVRKPGSEYEQVTPWLPNSDQQDDTSLSTVHGSIPVHQYYDMGLVASTEHLRTNSSSPGFRRSGIMSTWGSGTMAKPLKSPTAFASRARISTMMHTSVGPAKFSPKFDAGLPTSPLHNRSSSMSMSTSFGLQEEKGIFGPLGKEDDDYQFCASNQRTTTDATDLKIGGLLPKKTSPMSTTSSNRDSDNAGSVASTSTRSTASGVSGSGLWGLKKTQGTLNSTSSLLTHGLNKRFGDSMIEKTEEEEDDDLFPDFDNKKKFTPPISRNASQRGSPKLLDKSFRTGGMSTSPLVTNLNLGTSPGGTPSLLSLSATTSHSSGPGQPPSPTNVLATFSRESTEKISLPAFEIGSVPDKSLLSESQATPTPGSMWSASNFMRPVSIEQGVFGRDRLGVSPVRSPIHSPIGSPARQEGEGEIEGFFGAGEIRTRMTKSRLWGVRN